MLRVGIVLRSSGVTFRYAVESAVLVLDLDRISLLLQRYLPLLLIRSGCGDTLKSIHILLCH